MFELFKSSSNRQTKLSALEQNKLMQEISCASDFRSIESKFNLLYDSMIYPIWTNLTKKYIPPLNSEDIRDIFQEAWIKLLENKEKYDGKSNVYNWVYIIKRNLIIDKIRKNERHGEISLQFESDVDDELEGDIPIPIDDLQVDEKIIAEETISIIEDAIDSISDELTRDLVTRRLIHNQKLQEIADELDLPLTSVHKKIKKAIESLKPKLQKIL